MRTAAACTILLLLAFIVNTFPGAVSPPVLEVASADTSVVLECSSPVKKPVGRKRGKPPFGVKKSLYDESSHKPVCDGVEEEAGEGGQDGERRGEKGKKGKVVKKKVGREGKKPIESKVLEIVCKQCRKEKGRGGRQVSLKSFFSISSKAEGSALKGTETERVGKPAESGSDEANANMASGPGLLMEVDGGVEGLGVKEEGLFCSRCRRNMEERSVAPLGPGQSSLRTIQSGKCPSMLKLHAYQKTAKEKGIAWKLQDREAQAVMHRECAFCGRPAALNPDGLNGINRLNHSEPYYGWGNVAAACKECNTMKHNHTIFGFSAICRHIATYNKLGDFGLFPQFFANNFSPKNPSSYLTKSKTHILSKEQFVNITSGNCFYCGKANKPIGPNRHFNGLDRIDSKVRVYSSTSVVAACGTCNTMKFRRSVQEFLSHCQRVAKHAQSGGLSRAEEEALDPVRSKIAHSQPPDQSRLFKMMNMSISRIHNDGQINNITQIQNDE